ncbi:ABC transporter permease subunit [Methanocella conradii]|uniref:ABC transporter permease subunit n=1 Tax=Methanocella conradii TaxID=1175444 RepID=UPI00157D74C4|nr:ABC transporter permease subunit [Methanocella conradii]
MRQELIVAGKEFRDHLTSKRFLAIFGVLLLLAGVGMAMGMDQYNKSLEEYKKSQAEYQQQPWFKEQVASLQKQIADAEASGAPEEEIQALRQQLDMLINPPMPSVLTVFGSLNTSMGIGGGYFSLILMLLSIAIGFDLITREREEGTLKSLLSHPVYRDAVINGKLIGALSILVVVMGSVFMITLAIMLFYGVVPTGNDLIRIAAYFVMALLYSSVFFAIATLFSTLAKNSAMSILLVLGVVIAMIIIPTFAPKIADAVMGPPPEIKPIILPEPTPMQPSENSTPEPIPISIPWDPAIEQYYRNKQMIIDSIDTISPMYSFDYKISPAILYKQGGYAGPIYALKRVTPYVYHEPTIWDSLAYVWTSILALVVELVAPLAASYVMFMRADIR